MARQLFTITVTHKGLGKSRVISGSEEFVVNAKAQAQALTWNEMWERASAIKREKEKVISEKNRAAQDKDTARRQAREETLRQKEDAATYKQEKLNESIERSEEAKKAIESIRGLLHQTLMVNDVVEWKSLKKTANFSERYPSQAPRPILDLLPKKPAPMRDSLQFNSQMETPAGLTAHTRQPQVTDKEFQPKLGFFKGLFISATERKKLVETAYEAGMSKWKTECDDLNSHNEKLLKNAHKVHQELMNEVFETSHRRWLEDDRYINNENSRRQAKFNNLTTLNAEHWAKAVSDFNQKKDEFDQGQLQHNAKIDALQRAYEIGDPSVVFDYFDIVLNASNYPECIPREWDMDYLEQSKTLVIDIQLPAPADLPRLKEVKYLASKDEFKESFLSESEINSLYDSVLYQIALRTIHEIFESDYANVVEAVSLNGIVNSIDKTTGKPIRACILSLQARRDAFFAIDLAHVDPKACFKAMKGVGSSQLHSLAAVAPILRLDRNDSRFVDAYAVAGTLDESTNLAAMDWEDFEHLVREMFEKEFMSTGGEVKVTQASRDGGVDAIAFDPDPIRGGKIVIQAKRYTNVVGVSAVRDLYGTVMNEGATKGILVTTADYGPDSYEFAKGKPLTLLNGGNLLHLLAKHGHKATIDIRAARLTK